MFILLYELIFIRISNNQVFQFKKLDLLVLDKYFSLLLLLIYAQKVSANAGNLGCSISSILNNGGLSVIEDERCKNMKCNYLLINDESKIGRSDEFIQECQNLMKNKDGNAKLFNNALEYLTNMGINRKLKSILRQPRPELDPESSSSSEEQAKPPTRKKKVTFSENLPASKEPVVKFILPIQPESKKSHLIYPNQYPAPVNYFCEDESISHECYNYKRNFFSHEKQTVTFTKNETRTVTAEQAPSTQRTSPVVISTTVSTFVTRTVTVPAPQYLTTSQLMTNGQFNSPQPSPNLIPSAISIQPNTIPQQESELKSLLKILKDKNNRCKKEGEKCTRKHISQESEDIEESMCFENCMETSEKYYRKNKTKFSSTKNNNRSSSFNYESEPKNSSKDKYITLTRLIETLKTVEVPFTLYREHTVTITKEKPITNYKVTTFTEEKNNIITKTVFSTVDRVNSSLIHSTSNEKFVSERIEKDVRAEIKTVLKTVTETETIGNKNRVSSTNSSPSLVIGSDNKLSNCVVNCGNNGTTQNSLVSPQVIAQSQASACPINNVQSPVAITQNVVPQAPIASPIIQYVTQPQSFIAPQNVPIVTVTVQAPSSPNITTLMLTKTKPQIVITQVVTSPMITTIVTTASHQSNVPIVVSDAMNTIITVTKTVENPIQTKLVSVQNPINLTTHYLTKSSVVSGINENEIEKCRRIIENAENKKAYKECYNMIKMKEMKTKLKKTENSYEYEDDDESIEEKEQLPYKKIKSSRENKNVKRKHKTVTKMCCNEINKKKKFVIKYSKDGLKCEPEEACNNPMVENLMRKMPKNTKIISSKVNENTVKNKSIQEEEKYSSNDQIVYI